jgi:mono/diheme cytochrome c family protein
MNEAISLTHRIAVTLFFLIYVVKTVLLLSNRADLLQKFTKTTKVPEMIVSALFLITGVYLMMGLEHISAMLWIKVILVLLSIPLAIIGFKKNNKILAALSLLMITASYGLAEVQKKKREKGAVVAETNINGSEIYALKCANCHGADGKLGFSGAADISKTAMDLATIKQTILQGKGLMVAVDVTDEQAAAVAAYVESEVKGK